jgi:stage IV sporulation protein FB
MKKYLKINPCLYGVLIITYLLGFLKEYLIMFLILFLHEISHLIVIKAEKIEISFIKIEPFGITIRLKYKLFKNPWEEIYMAMSGPLCNFLLFFLCFFIFKDAENLPYLLYIFCNQSYPVRF